MKKNKNTFNFLVYLSFYLLKVRTYIINEYVYGYLLFIMFYFGFFKNVIAGSFCEYSINENENGTI